MPYATVIFDRLEKNDDGTNTMVFRYVGDAGEPTRYSKHSVSTAVMPDSDYARGLAMNWKTVLNTNLSFYAGALSAVGTTLDTTTPLPTPSAAVFNSYRAATSAFTPGATPQDVMTIAGSATRTVVITGIGICSVQTTAGINSWQLLRRSTANTGGTSATVAAVPNDDSYSAATAVIRQYTANPTAGTLVGNVWSGRIVSPAPASVASMLGRDFDFQPAPIVLTGTTDVLAWNFNGAALPSGLSVQAWVSWQEIA